MWAHAYIRPDSNAIVARVAAESGKVLRVDTMDLSALLQHQPEPGSFFLFGDLGTDEWARGDGRRMQPGTPKS